MSKREKTCTMLTARQGALTVKELKKLVPRSGKLKRSELVASYCAATTNPSKIKPIKPSKIKPSKIKPPKIKPPKIKPPKIKPTKIKTKPVHPIAKTKSELTCAGVSARKGAYSVKELRTMFPGQAKTKRADLVKLMCHEPVKKKLDETDGKDLQTHGATKIKTCSIDLNTCKLSSFKQVHTLCWIHAASVALFFSDAGRNALWHLAFELGSTKSGQIYPIALSDHPRPKTMADLPIILEIIRQNLEYALTTVSTSEATRCNLLLEKMVCSTLAKHRHWCADGITGGYPDYFVESIAQLYPRAKIKIKIVSNAVLKTGETYIAVVKKINYNHVICVLTCNGKTYYFDNEEEIKSVSANRSVSGIILVQKNINEVLWLCKVEFNADNSTCKNSIQKPPTDQLTAFESKLTRDEAKFFDALKVVHRDAIRYIFAHV